MDGAVGVELKGLPVSVGEVSGIARVVTHLAEAHTIQVRGLYKPSPHH